MSKIPFIRIYTQSDGTTQKGALQTVERSPEIAAMASRFLNAGGYYTISLGAEESVRLCCMDQNLDVLTGLDVKNGPELGPAVDDLVRASQEFIRKPTRSELLASARPVVILH